MEKNTPKLLSRMEALLIRFRAFRLLCLYLIPETRSNGPPHPLSALLLSPLKFVHEP
jgi:hypothetical protein